MAKDQELLVLHRHMDAAAEALEGYQRRLADEIAATEQPGGDEDLRRILKSQLAFADRMWELLDGEVWDLLLEMTNRSGSLNVAREGRLV